MRVAPWELARQPAWWVSVAEEAMVADAKFEEHRRNNKPAK